MGTPDEKARAFALKAFAVMMAKVVSAIPDSETRILYTPQGTTETDWAGDVKSLDRNVFSYFKTLPEGIAIVKFHLNNDTGKTLKTELRWTPPKTAKFATISLLFTDGSIDPAEYQSEASVSVRFTTADGKASELFDPTQVVANQHRTAPFPIAYLDNRLSLHMNVPKRVKAYTLSGYLVIVLLKTEENDIKEKKPAPRSLSDSTPSITSTQREKPPEAPAVQKPKEKNTSPPLAAPSAGEENKATYLKMEDPILIEKAELNISFDTTPHNFPRYVPDDAPENVRSVVSYMKQKSFDTLLPNLNRAIMALFPQDIKEAVDLYKLETDSISNVADWEVNQHLFQDDVSVSGKNRILEDLDIRIHDWMSLAYSTRINAVAPGTAKKAEIIRAISARFRLPGFSLSQFLRDEEKISSRTFTLIVTECLALMMEKYLAAVEQGPILRWAEHLKSVLVHCRAEFVTNFILWCALKPHLGRYDKRIEPYLAQLLPPGTFSAPQASSRADPNVEEDVVLFERSSIDLLSRYDIARKMFEKGAAVHPNFNQLGPHQKFAIYWLLCRKIFNKSSGMLAFRPGLGKTLTAVYGCLVMDELEKDENADRKTDIEAGLVLVLCPKYIKPDWAKALEALGLKYVDVAEGKTLKDPQFWQQNARNRTKFVLSTVELLRLGDNKEVFKTKAQLFTHIIVDESHKNYVDEQNISFEFLKTITQGKPAMLLTGTPYSIKVDQLVTQLLSANIITVEKDKQASNAKNKQASNEAIASAVYLADWHPDLSFPQPKYLHHKMKYNLRKGEKRLYDTLQEIIDGLGDQNAAQTDNEDDDESLSGGNLMLLVTTAATIEMLPENENKREVAAKMKQYIEKTYENLRQLNGDRADMEWFRPLVDGKPKPLVWPYAKRPRLPREWEEYKVHENLSLLSLFDKNKAFDDPARVGGLKSSRLQALGYLINEKIRILDDPALRKTLIFSGRRSMLYLATQLIENLYEQKMEWGLLIGPSGRPSVAEQKIEAANKNIKQRIKDRSVTNQNSPNYVVKKFKEKQTMEYLIGQDSMMSAGINLPEAKHIILLTSGTSAAPYNQKIARAIRKGQGAIVNVYEFSSRTPYDNARDSLRTEERTKYDMFSTDIFEWTSIEESEEDRAREQGKDQDENEDEDDSPLSSSSGAEDSDEEDEEGSEGSSDSSSVTPRRKRQLESSSSSSDEALY